MLSSENAKVSRGELSVEELFPGMAFSRVLDPEKGGSQAFRMSVAALPPACGTPRHVHMRCDEGWYILSGKGLFYHDGQQVEFCAGDFLYAPRAVVHQMVNMGDEGLTFIAITAPPCDFRADNRVIEPFDLVRHGAAKVASA